jgi:outer membrane protein
MRASGSESKMMGQQKPNKYHRNYSCWRRGCRSRAAATTALVLFSLPSGYAQQSAAVSNGPDQSDLPAAPAPALTQPYPLKVSPRDFSKPYARFTSNPIKRYEPTTIGKASFANSMRLNDLIKDGKIYLGVSDAIALALENNYDIAIARYDLDIADTDILRTETGNLPLGVPTGVVANTVGGTPSTLVTGGGPGGTSIGSGGAGSGVSGLTLTTAGAGPAPESLDPFLTSSIQFDRDHVPTTTFLSSGTSTTNQYDFAFTQGFVTGTNFQVGFNNEYLTTSNPTAEYLPELYSSFKATLTQHLLQGFGVWVNKRFIYQALNDRRIADSSFRQQLLYTVNQVENIYWGLVQAYEDVQAKQRALDQSSRLLRDNQKQLDIGTMSPLDVYNAAQTVALDQDNLINAESVLNYQQEIMKQAIARNLNDPVLSAAPVIPTDRVSLDPIAEEQQPVEALVQEAFQQRPELEQAVLTIQNDEITVKGAKNGLLPTFDVFGYLTGQGVGGDINPRCVSAGYCNSALAAQPGTGYGTALGNALDESTPDKGVGFNLQIPLRNRYAQSVQARSLMEYRQAELRLEQLYTQIRMQVLNARFALSNDRGQVKAAMAARDYNQKSLDAEIKRFRLGASTTAIVLLQQRNLAASEDILIAANAAYAKDRAGLYQTLATTLQHYGINLGEAAMGEITTAPLVPGVAPAPPGNEPAMSKPSDQ